MVTVTQGLEKFIKLFLSIINLMVSGPIPAVHCMQLSHTCPFSKVFKFCTFLPKLPNIFHSSTLICSFSEKSQLMPLLSRIGPGCNIEKFLGLINLMVYLLESIELKVVRLQSQINIFDTALMF